MIAMNEEASERDRARGGNVRKLNSKQGGQTHEELVEEDVAAAAAAVEFRGAWMPDTGRRVRG